MGERARERYLERTTPSQRLDDGLRMADAAIQAQIKKLDLPEGLTPEERARRIAKHLRSL